MNSDSIVVFERRRNRLPELQRHFDSPDVRLRGCVSPADVLQSVEEGARLVVLVLEEAEAACLELLRRLAELPAPVRVVVVSSRENADLEWPLRELGAAAFLPEDITGDELADVCRRLMRGRSSTVVP